MRIHSLRNKHYLLSLAIIMTALASSGQTLPKNEPVKFLALGDSYTIGESVAEAQRWPVQLVNALMLAGYTCHKPEIVAVTGWRTDELKDAVVNGNLPKDFNLVSLSIGVNNQYQGKDSATYRTEFEELLKVAIEHAAGIRSNVFVLSIPDYGYTPFGRENQSRISAEIDAFNAINRAVASAYNVTYINITDISRRGFEDPALIAEDGLHPSGMMYALWVERILEVLR